MIRIGTSGYSFDDWVGSFYPVGLAKGDRLLHYAREFSVVEVNSTYYRIPHPIVLRKMEEKTPDGFEFVVKAHQSFTHEAGRDPTLVQQFLAVLDPLIEKGKFRGVLLQFPWGFQRSPANLDRLAWIRDALPAMPIWAEFRHDSWSRDEIFDFLAAREIGYCAVDEPRLRGLMPPIVRVTNGSPYFRFHGRNEQNWWGRGTGDRYDYEYREDEIREWVPKIREADLGMDADPGAGATASSGSTAAGGARRTFVFFNNCHVGQAVRSARILKKLLEVT